MKTTDDEIIRRVIEGNQRAYAELVDRHKDKAMMLSMRMLKNRSEAEEALQDAFVRAYRALPSFERKSSFSTWFYRIVFNVCSSSLNKRGSNNLLSIDIESDDELKIEIPSIDDVPDIELESKEFSEIVRREISIMEEAYASILTMFFLQEMSYEEITVVTGLPLGTVKKQIVPRADEITICRNAAFFRNETNGERMKNPKIPELMEYLDGTLHPLRYKEIETLISTSSSLQKEILLLKAVQKTVRNDIVFPMSKKFTANVMEKILPAQQESFWFRLLKNSSNMFAMVLVLSMIGIVLVSAPSSSTGSTTMVAKSIESYTTVYNSAVETISMWIKQYTHPVNQAAKTSSGKFLMIGLFVFFIFMIVDDLFGKRYFHPRIKN